MPDTKRTLYEQETIFLTNEDDKWWHVYTFNRKLINKLNKFAAEFPELCYLEKIESDGGQSFNVLKDRTSINFVRPLSEERKEELRLRAKQNFSH